MNRKTETILAWIANGLSIIYLLLTCLSLLVMKSGQIGRASCRERV